MLFLIGVHLCSSVVSLSYSAEFGGPLDVTDRTQLAADSTWIADSDGVSFKLHQGTKHPANPLIKADKPWEGWRISLYGTVLYDSAERVFKLWYCTDTTEAFPHYAVAYAISRDGLAWEKPLVGTVSSPQFPQHNVVLADHLLPSVIKDEAEKDPQRRYKMLAWGQKPKPEGGPHVYASPDGLRWTKLSDKPICTSNDVITMTRDPRSGQYLAFPKLSTKHRGHVRRCFGISTSDDFLKWTAPRYVFKPDARDDAGTLGRIQAVRPMLDVPDDPMLMRTEFYGIGLYPSDSCLVTFPWVFSINNNARYGNQEGPSEIQFAVSSDLENFRREFRTPIVPHGPLGSWDSGFLASASHAIRVSDEIRLYYSGGNYTHGTPCLYRAENTGRGDRYTNCIGLAIWKLDRFVSADARGRPGKLLTLPLKYDASRLLLNFQTAPAGSITVRALALDGRVILESQPLSGDQLRRPVTWKPDGNAAALKGHAIRLQFTIADAQLYSFRLER